MLYVMQMSKILSFPTKCANQVTKTSHSLGFFLSFKCSSPPSAENHIQCIKCQSVAVLQVKRNQLCLWLQHNTLLRGWWFFLNPNNFFFQESANLWRNFLLGRTKIGKLCKYSISIIRSLGNFMYNSTKTPHNLLFTKN